MHTRATIVRTFCAAGLTIAMAGAGAQADTISSILAGPISGTATMKFNSTGKGERVRIAVGGDPAETTFAGQLRHTISSATGTGAALGLTGPFTTFCADIDQRVSGSNTTYAFAAVRGVESSSPMGADKERMVFGLYGLAGSSATRANASNELAAAFQVAIWEIITDYSEPAGAASLSLTGGGFRVMSVENSAPSPAIAAIVNGWFATLASASSTGFVNPGVLGLTSATAQDQLIVVPAPGAALTLGALASFVAFRRRHG
jgi:hypothetical protein